MNNPIHVFEKIRDNFILYLETAFGTRFSDFEEERNALMKRDKVFARSPWVEPLPNYKPSDFTIDEIEVIPNLNDSELDIFKRIVKAGLFGENKLYEHQWQMLSQAMEGNHCVITSGTGSGKTESFLLPLFAYLSKEMCNWKNIENKINNTNWWSETGYGPVRMIDNFGKLSTEVKQRPSPKRAPAVRAMVIYPMNALVEDQLSRLRKALDSNDARDVLSVYNDNRIYFGRYNGTSPVSGVLLPSDGTNGPNTRKNKWVIDRLKKALKEIHTNITEVTSYINQNPDNKTEQELKDLLANFQRLDGAEMRTRFDMQEAPPDILITNFSMLSIMLMREIDNPLLKKTKEWLSCTSEFDYNLSDDEIKAEKRNRIFHLIIDELHLYRGGSGSETAFLIRILLQRLGLTPDSDQLRILASSASLEGDEGKLFLKNFFGTENKEIQIIEGTQIEPIGKSEILLDAKLFEKVGKKSFQIEREIVRINYDQVDQYINGIIEVENANLVKLVFDFQNEINKKLFQAFRVEERVRAVPAFKNGSHDINGEVISLSEVLFGQNESENYQAIKGLLYILGIYEKFQIKTSFARLRFHLFYRNIGGLWAELKSDSEMQANPASMPIVNLMTTPLLISNNKRTLEVLYCENCGTIAYGGNRIDIRDEQDDIITELLSLSSDIEEVPESSAATIVEKRKYKDFSVFYPGEFNGDIIQPENSIPTNANTDFIAEWEVAWINVKSGRISLSNPNNITDYKKGLWYRVKDNGIDIKQLNETDKVKSIGALPCSCPQCKSDYSKYAPKKKKFSSFRGFRTGFGKVSQILSKELFSELPEGEARKKLVAFSDSREDAAKLAKNIEEEHYVSLVREVLIHNITNELQFDGEVICAVENNLLDEITRLVDINPNRVGQINGVINNARIHIPKDIIELENLRNNIKHISSFIDIVIKNLLELGINPAGPFKSTQRVSKLNGDDYEYVHWSNAFDFNNYCYKNGYYYRTRNRANNEWERINISEHFNRIIEENLANFIFGKLFYSFEASGLGYATIIQSIDVHALRLDILPEVLKQICNSFLRIWGDTYKHNRSDFPTTIYSNYTALPNGRRERKFIKKVADHLRKDENILGDIVFEILAQSGHASQVQINNLYVKLVNKASNYFKCTNCGTVHLHASAGICVFCLNELSIEPEIDIVENLWKKNYLTSNLLLEYNPFRLHTEELSGQTDDQLNRQREFKNIFINKEDKKVKGIDLLSVTTTLEVGVDIGSLQAILLANMPPQRFNYQQRVGRTGRRGQMFSYALTIARGRSHDEFYFENPISITGDKPPQPFLSLGQEKIFKRILVKAILQRAFTSFGHLKGSVHGEFGDILEYKNTYHVRLNEYLIENINSDIRTIFNSLNKGIYVEKVLSPYQFDNYRQWILELPQAIMNKIESTSNTNMDLSEFLAENGFLPLQGMPTRVRNLIHGFKEIGDNQGYEATTMNRDLGIAIYDYAPGSQKTKDKGVVQSIGFTPDITGIKYSFDTKRMEADTQQDDAFTFRIWMKQDNTTLQLQVYEYDSLNQDGKFGKPDEEEGYTIFLGATPAAFRTDLNYPKDSNEDFDINFSKPITFAVSQEVTPRNTGNASISYSGQDTTWKINNNGKNQFIGKYYKSYKCGAELPKQWLVNDLTNLVPVPDAEDEVLSMVSRKVTEVFRLEPYNLPLSIEIDPFSNDKFKLSSSKGAFYSAAFLLQRTLATKLDIDPEEIEIAAIESIELPRLTGVEGRKSARIVLADELPNGSGFVEQLYNNFEYYIRRCIAPETSTEERYNYNIINNRSCLDASYQDLKSYRNMSFHSLLDWRLAVGLLRLMNDNTYTSGLRDEDYLHPELVNWYQFATELRDKFVESFSENIHATTFGNLAGLIFKNDFKVIIVHPFWNTSSNQPEVNILTNAIAEAGIHNLYFIDTFNLHRRPSWCYKQLINKIQESL